MLSENSSLRRIPANVDRKQAVFIDGIRHSAEIIELAYKRLSNTLTELAYNPPSSSELQLIMPHVFLDAWAVVDAVDKFRLLYQGFPSMVRTSGNEPTLQKVTEPFKKIRDIADHCAGTVDKVVSKNTSGLGIITWLTAKQTLPIQAWYCTIRPGSMQSEHAMKWPEIESKLNWPTDCICLSVGGYISNLSSILPHIEKRVKGLEVELDRTFQGSEFKQVPVINDVFTRQSYAPSIK